MAQAAKALSIPGDDRNDDDPGREHFDATLLACGEAVARLVNSSPRTPTAEEICELIRATLREGFESSEAEALDATLWDGNRRLGCSDDPSDPHDFKAIPELTFDWRNDEFAKHHAPPMRLAVKFLQNDRDAAVKAVRALLADGHAGAIDSMHEAWKDARGRFSAYLSVLNTALARLEFCRSHVEEAH